MARPGLEQEAAGGEFRPHAGQQKRRHLGLEILDHAEAKAAQPRGIGKPNARPAARELVEHRLGMGQEGAAGRGQGEGARAAVDELGAKRRLKRGDLLADGRGRDRKPARGGGDRALLGQRHQHLHRPEADPLPLPRHSPPPAIRAQNARPLPALASRDTRRGCIRARRRNAPLTQAAAPLA
ncbi:hypothetical protein SDC9_39431 [bioreactor metagenome]|uniref:Uncharacterized protein n=1 Tax=bioreactor metagenome TaxID=1076179 RepID=A0A644VPM4_9ZZZZ